jgi:formylglycine-generating enzyme required for sulfatase activity
MERAGFIRIRAGRMRWLARDLTRLRLLRMAALLACCGVWAAVSMADPPATQPAANQNIDPKFAAALAKAQGDWTTGVAAADDMALTGRPAELLANAKAKAAKAEVQASTGNARAAIDLYGQALRILKAAAPTALGGGNAKPANKGPRAFDEMTNSIGMRLVLIPPGKFKMGSPDNEPGRKAVEGPQHEVKLTKGFWMAKFCVTGAQMKMVGSGQVAVIKDDEAPAILMSWGDAVNFCNKLSQLDKHQYRLPTEAQWEYACRAGTTTMYFFGEDAKQIKDYVWYGGDGGQNNSDPTKKKPNPWGLYGMNGGVWQWCSDWYSSYHADAQVDPQGPAVGTEIGPSGHPGIGHILRGGSYEWGAESQRSAVRIENPPGERSFAVGFRVVMDP